MIGDEMDDTPAAGPCIGSALQRELASLRSELARELADVQRQRAEISAWVAAQQRWFRTAGEALQQDARERAEVRRLLERMQSQLAPAAPSAELPQVVHRTQAAAPRWWRWPRS